MIEEVQNLRLPGVKLITPKYFGDERGYFAETYNLRDYCEIAIGEEFCQDNESFSQKGVIRGMHYQVPPYAQAKLIRVLQGRILDVVLDLRQGSPGYGQWEAVELSKQNRRILYVPRGMAHGFAVLDGAALISYKCSAYWQPQAERCIAADDCELAIQWPYPHNQWIRSQKDSLGSSWREYANSPVFSWNSSSCS